MNEESTRDTSTSPVSERARVCVALEGIATIRAAVFGLHYAGRLLLEETAEVDSLLGWLLCSLCDVRRNHVPNVGHYLAQVGDDLIRLHGMVRAAAGRSTQRIASKDEERAAVATAERCLLEAMAALWSLTNESEGASPKAFERVHSAGRVAPKLELIGDGIFALNYAIRFLADNAPRAESVALVADVAKEIEDVRASLRTVDAMPPPLLSTQLEYSSKVFLERLSELHAAFVESCDLAEANGVEVIADLSVDSVRRATEAALRSALEAASWLGGESKRIARRAAVAASTPALTPKNADKHMETWTTKPAVASTRGRQRKSNASRGGANADAAR